MYKLHTQCRACGYAAPGPGGTKSPNAEKLIPVFDLGIQPLANDFCREGQERAGYAPLSVLYCPRCSLAQLSVVVDPDILYSRYNYVTSPSAMMRAHFERLLVEIKAETGGNRLLEIGSNDGRLLAFLRDFGYSVRGVDPASNLVQVAHLAGLETVCGAFNHRLAGALPVQDVIVARHVFCHVDDWLDFMRGVQALCHPESLVLIEVPYAGDTLARGEFDQIYHEHLSFLTLKAMRALLDRTDLRLHRVVRCDIHGGTLLLLLRHKDSAKLSTAELEPENITQEDWTKFWERAMNQIFQLRTLVLDLVRQGKSVAALGASAKSTVWINACHFTRKQIVWIADETIQKNYATSPGSDIPIVDEGAILRELPEYLVVFAWNYLPEIQEKFAPAIARGVKLIVPVPEVRVLDVT